MTCQAHRSQPPALDADWRAVELLATARLRNLIDDRAEKFECIITSLKLRFRTLDKPSEEAEIASIERWANQVRHRLLAMTGECDKEFASLDESVRDEAEQALGS